MVVWHVTSGAKFERYKKTGKIISPVRAWEDLKYAQRMSLRTGRRIILRLKFPENAKRLEGHFGNARILNHDYKLEKGQY